MSEIGHNNPPEALTAKVKLERIQAIVDRSDLTAAQKCIAVGIVVQADRDGVASVKTADLQRFASAKDRETVFRATKLLHAFEIINKDNRRGQSGRYTVLPPRVVDAVIDAYNANKSGRVKADGMGDEHPVRFKPTTLLEPVGSKPTSLVNPVGSEPTGPVSPDQPRAHAPTRIENPSGLLFPEEGNNPPFSPQADEPAKEKTTQARRLPDDWQLPPEWRAAVAKQFEISDDDITKQSRAFRDFWCGLGGAKACKRDWLATWRNWLRKNYRERIDDAPAGTPKLWWQNPENVRAMSLDRWRKGIQQHANGIWHVDKLGPPPGHPKCVVPPAIVDEMRLTELYTDGGIKRR